MNYPVFSVMNKVSKNVFFGEEPPTQPTPSGGDLAALQSQLEKAKAQIAELSASHATSTKKAAEEYQGKITELTGKLADFEKFKLEVEEERRKREIESKEGDVEKLKTAHAHELTKREKELEALRAEITGMKELHSAETTKQQNLITGMRLNSLKADIRSAAALNNAYNPDQIVHLILDNFEYNEELGSYIATTKDAKNRPVTLEVAEFVEQYLKDEKNANLVKSSAKPGTGGQGGDNKGGGKPGDPEGGKKKVEDGSDANQLVDLGNGTSSFSGRLVKNEYLAQFPVTDLLKREAANAGYSVDFLRFQKAVRYGQQKEFKLQQAARTNS